MNICKYHSFMICNELDIIEKHPLLAIKYNIMSSIQFKYERNSCNFFFLHHLNFKPKKFTRNSCNSARRTGPSRNHRRDSMRSHRNQEINFFAIQPRRNGRDRRGYHLKMLSKVGFLIISLIRPTFILAGPLTRLETRGLLSTLP